MAIDVEAQKRAAAARAVEFVRPGMRLGLGTGSTAKHFVEQMEKEGLDTVGVKRMRTPEVIAFLVRTNVVELVVNAMLPDERVYSREDLMTMLRMVGEPV